MARVNLSTRPAFSLIEIILVLAIMVAIGAIVVPSFGDAFLRQRLISMAEKVRSEWDRARLKAMKTGQIQVFSCVLESGSYSVEPFMSGDDVLSASSGATIATVGGTVAEATAEGTLVAPSASGAEAQELDEGVTFASCLVSGDMRAASVAQSQGGIAAVSATAQSVMFYPDGSTSTAEVVIQDASGAQRAVRLRGLTGTTQVITPGELPTVVSATPAAESP
jgi:Tfp pilus assembly protein FimT